MQSQKSPFKKLKNSLDTRNNSVNFQQLSDTESLASKEDSHINNSNTKIFTLPYNARDMLEVKYFRYINANGQVDQNGPVMLEVNYDRKRNAPKRRMSIICTPETFLRNWRNGLENLSNHTTLYDVKHGIKLMPMEKLFAAVTKPAAVHNRHSRKNYEDRSDNLTIQYRFSRTMENHEKMQSNNISDEEKDAIRKTEKVLFKCEHIGYGIEYETAAKSRLTVAQQLEKSIGARINDPASFVEQNKKIAATLGGLMDNKKILSHNVPHFLLLGTITAHKQSVDAGIVGISNGNTRMASENVSRRRSMRQAAPASAFTGATFNTPSFENRGYR